MMLHSCIPKTPNCVNIGETFVFTKVAEKIRCADNDVIVFQTVPADLKSELPIQKRLRMESAFHFYRGEFLFLRQFQLH
jgi:hypothetical protein